MPAQLVQYEVFVDTDVFDAYLDVVNKVPALAEGALKLAIKRSRARIRAKLVEPDLPDLPFVWSFDPAANARARRYYFAVIVPQQGGPGGRYQRTGDLLEGIEVTAQKINDGNLIYLGTDFDRASYVIGERQVPGHHKWFRLDEISLEESERLTEDMIDLWFTFTDPFAGIL